MPLWQAGIGETVPKIQQNVTDSCVVTVPLSIDEGCCKFPSLLCSSSESNSLHFYSLVDFNGLA